MGDGTPRVTGGRIWVVRLFDVAETIDIARARDLLAPREVHRGAAALKGPVRPPGGVVLATPPLDVDVGSEDLAPDEPARVTVRLYDFGVASVRFALPIAPGTPWADLVLRAQRLEALQDEDALARAVADRVLGALGAARNGPHTVALAEDYVIFEVHGVEGYEDAAAALRKVSVGALLYAEAERPLAATVEVDLRARALQHNADDAVVVAWNAALLLGPDGNRDAREVLEVALAQLLELRYYDHLLRGHLARIYDDAQQARAGRTLFRSPFVAVARAAAALFVEVTDLAGRIEGALTLEGDSYIARVYRQAVRHFRLEEAAAGVDGKLATLARVAEVLEGEIHARRGTLLEVAVVLLIVVEVVLSLVRH